MILTQKIEKFVPKVLIYQVDLVFRGFRRAEDQPLLIPKYLLLTPLLSS
jgi:hypothetical protein